MELGLVDRQRIKAARARKGWSLRTASAHTGASVGVWQRAESGGSIEYSSLVKIVDALGLDIHDFVLPVDPDPEPEPIQMAAHGVDLEELRRRDPDAYRQVEDLARTFLDRARERDQG